MLPEHHPQRPSGCGSAYERAVIFGIRVSAMVFFPEVLHGSEGNFDCERGERVIIPGDSHEQGVLPKIIQ